ncbi:protein of unknown function [Azospirillum baldaniorum]|uniref:Uncharacterized protein n=1 Tax=Azospirillum baldaniorum TaxID=1064539 RepID=A0A9P1JMW8_9PROT|nr:protein of unknown function [Azospirillum baldaniorum]
MRQHSLEASEARGDRPGHRYGGTDRFASRAFHVDEGLRTGRRRLPSVHRVESPGVRLPLSCARAANRCAGGDG